MIKELLEKEQPIVYHALNNAVKENRISSAWLFTGPYGTPKYDAALLLAQSIFCEENNGELACESCNTCRRVKEGLYSDLSVLDGRETTISKDMVDSLQEKFSKTALEKNGQRVYIIRNCENATVAAQNSMLKFLEEPGKGITAILITDNVNKLLPTIISRCTVLPFLPAGIAKYENLAVNCGFSKENAFLVAHLVKDADDLNKMWDETKGEPSLLYKHICMMVKQFLNADCEERTYLSCDYETAYLSSLKDAGKAKKENLLLLNGFYELILLFGRCVLEKKQSGPSWFINAVNSCSYSEKQIADLMTVMSEEMDLCNKYNDLNLVFYQTMFRIRELKL